MRQLKNCKKGHFVKYNGVLYQIYQICRFSTSPNGKRATLVEIKDGSRRVITPSITEKVEYLGDHAKDKKGRVWFDCHKLYRPVHLSRRPENDQNG